MSRIISRLRTPIYQNTGSTARDHLASERTFLAWIRTGLGFIALGIAIERFSRLDIDAVLQSLKNTDTKPSTPTRESRAQRQKTPGQEHVLVASLLGSGAGSIIYGTTRYFSNLKLLEAGLFKPAFHGVGVLSIAVAGIAGGAYWGAVGRGNKGEEKV